MAQHRGGTDAGQQEAAAKGKRSSFLDLRWSTWHTTPWSVTAMVLMQGDVCVKHSYCCKHKLCLYIWSNQLQGN